MRSNTEKLAVFRKLRDSGKARTDLQLLERQRPGYAGLHRFRINPERYADDILFALLDSATEQAILDNRNPGEQVKESEAAAPDKVRAAAKAKSADEAPVPTEAKKKSSRKKRSILKSIGMIFLT